MKSLLPLIFILIPYSIATAQTTESDSIKTQDLKEIVVEAQLQSTSATVSTYIPTSKQKNSSQSGVDLLNHMAIPQLSLSMDNTVRSSSGKPVDIYIDFLPATEQDLSGMRMTDVKKVEYYDYPDDPRFQGNAHVINFIMQKYEYGGYIKASGDEYFLANSGQLNLYSKVQYKKMTYDLAIGGYYRDSSHDFNNTVETYRLPQNNGTVQQFERYSITDNAISQRRYYWPTFKALYRTETITIRNIIGAKFDNFPKENTSGSVYFSPSDYQQNGFISEANHRENYVAYNGFWNFILPHDNMLLFVPYYSYSNTRQNSLYVEKGSQTQKYRNNATDDSHQANANLQLQHDFGKWGKFTVNVQSIYTKSRTRYNGTASTLEKLTTLRVGPGTTYSFSNEKFYGMIGVGFIYDRSKLGSTITEDTKPWADMSLQYAFNNKNSVNLEFHHMNASPSLNYRSSAVIQSNPLMSYTGNPNLTAYRSFDLGASYQWFPNNRFIFSIYGSGYLINNRFAYVYEASSDGILRSVQQPMGRYMQGSYGLNGVARLLNGNLQIRGQLSHIIAKSGEPYEWTKSHINWALQAFYYVDQWQFGLQYHSKVSSPNGFVNGTWVNSKDAYTATVGWGNSSWNIKAQISNFFRWNWRNGTTVLHSKYYDFIQTAYNPNKHCFVSLSATYNFGFGKKIQVGDEASQVSGASSAILK